MAYNKQSNNLIKHQDSTFTPLSRQVDPDYPGYFVLEDIMLRYSSPKSAKEKYIRRYKGTSTQLRETYKAIRGEELSENTYKTWMVRHIQKKWIPVQKGTKSQCSIWEYDKRAPQRVYDAFGYTPDPCMVILEESTVEETKSLGDISECSCIPDDFPDVLRDEIPVIRSVVTEPPKTKIPTFQEKLSLMFGGSARV